MCQAPETHTKGLESACSACNLTKFLSSDELPDDEPLDEECQAPETHTTGLEVKTSLAKTSLAENPAGMLDGTFRVAYHPDIPILEIIGMTAAEVRRLYRIANAMSTGVYYDGVATRAVAQRLAKLLKRYS